MKENLKIRNTKRNLLYIAIAVILTTITVDKCLQSFGKEKHWTLELSDGSVIKGNFRKSLFSFSAPPMTIYKWEVREAKED